jgi:RNA polymerase sigma-B factor
MDVATVSPIARPNNARSAVPPPADPLAGTPTGDPAPEWKAQQAELALGRREHAHRMFAGLAQLSPGTPEHRRLRAELVETHLPLALYFARRYAGRGEPFDDLVQAGALGLVKAVDRFDPDRGIAFSTFAGKTILGEIRRHFRDRTWAVHVYRSLQVLTGQVGVCVQEMTQELGRTPTVAELAARMDLPPERVRESLRCSASYRATSFETPAGEGRTLGDLLGREDPAFNNVVMHESLRGSLARLPERERRILQLRFYGDMTQAQIGARLGISQMHVSRVLKRTLARLREELADTG